MSYYPVHYHLERPEKFERLQLLMRFVVFLAIGLLGLSFGLIFGVLYLALPAVASSRLSDNEELYLHEDGPKIKRFLHWVAAVGAWVGLTVEHLPGKEPEKLVEFVIDEQPSFKPTARMALWRVVTGLPSLLVLMVLSWVGFLMWAWMAVSILLAERVRSAPFNYLQGLQRWTMRLLAYQACLVEEYPPFSFDDKRPGLPSARVVSDM